MDNKEKEIRIEDLLKIKSAERPNEAFWEDFDLELNERALKTCIQKESLHERIGTRLVDQVLPISSALIVVLLFGAVSLIQFFQPDGTQSNYALGPVKTLSSEAPVFEVARDDLNLMANDGSILEDYAVEIITISSDSEALDFAADEIPVAIGSTANYTESGADSNTLKYTQAYAQLASYAF